MENGTLEKQEYIDAWNNKVNYITGLGMDLLDDLDNDEVIGEITSITDRLKEIVKISADYNFK